MGIADVFLRSLEEHADRAFVTEVPSERRVPARGGRWRDIIKIARRPLRDAGVHPGGRVVLVARTSARGVACDLAILAEGATSVPRHDRAEPEQLARAVRNREPQLLIAGDTATRKVLASRIPVEPSLLERLVVGAPSPETRDSPETREIHA